MIRRRTIGLWVGWIVAVWAGLATIWPSGFQIGQPREAFFKLLWGEKTFPLLISIVALIVLSYLGLILRRIDRLEQLRTKQDQDFQTWLRDQERRVSEEFQRQFRHLETDVNNAVETQGKVLNRFHHEYDGRLRTVEEQLQARSIGVLGLEVVYDPARYPDCLHRQLDGTTLFRVGLLNRGERTIERVKVYMESISPNPLGFGNMELRIMHDRPPWDRSLHGVDVNPGDSPTFFVDVASVFHTIEAMRPGTHFSADTTSVELALVREDVPRRLTPPPHQYTFILKGEAPNMRSLVRSFRIDPNRGIVFT